MSFDILHRWKRAVVYHSNTAEDLSSAILEATKSRADLSLADLRGAVLSLADLRCAVLRGAVLSGADLRGAVLSGAVLRGAVLSGADLSGADLRGAVLIGADLSRAVLSGAVLSGAVLREGIPTIPEIHKAVYHAASQPNALNMATWHTCETTHCRAGWVIALSGAAGKAIEFCLGTPAAAALIYHASDPNLDRVPDFYASNEDALADMKRLADAKTEKESAQ